MFHGLERSKSPFWFIGASLSPSAPEEPDVANDEVLGTAALAEPDAVDDEVLGTAALAEPDAVDDELGIESSAANSPRSEATKPRPELLCKDSSEEFPSW